VNRYQLIAVGIAAINLLLIFLFPPFDQYSIASASVPVFAGFHIAFSPPAYGEINISVLTLEVLVVLINAGIAWLLLRDKVPATTGRKFGLQNATLVAIGVNLVVMLLFPPFESVFALTKATLPSFEGFYFIFSRQPNHTIVTALLYIELVFILVNGALFWLIFNDRPRPPTHDEVFALAAQMRSKGGN